MSIGVSIEVNDQGIQDLLSVTQRRLQDLTPAFKNIGEYMVRQREELFRDEKDPEGRPWAPLAESTKYSIFRKKKTAKKGFRALAGKKILTQDHHLKRTVYKAGADQVVVGPDKTSQAYAAIHQFGGKAGRGRKVTIPARPHLGFNAENKKEFIEIIKDHLMGIS